MPHINYEIPKDLHRALKVRAATEGVTLKDLIIRLLYGTGPDEHQDTTGPQGP